MSITVTDEEMTCTDSPHWAWPDGGRWIVSWLQHPVDHNAAITALNLAELHGGSTDYQHMDAWKREALAATFAAELDVSSDQAAERVHTTEQQARSLRERDR